MKYQIKSFLVFYILFIFNSQYAIGQHVDKEVIQKLESKPFVKVIVVLKEQANVALASSIKGKSEKALYVHNLLEQTAKNSQGDLRDYLFRKGFNYTSYNIVNAIAVNADKDAIDWLSKRPEVYQIIEDQDMPAERYFLADGNASLRSPEPTWGITNIGAEQLWEKGFKGQGVVIGGQDTGYSWNESPIKNKYRGFISLRGPLNFSVN
nr:protease inhibitor I9 family protein [Saprospiraceae bacterium]